MEYVENFPTLQICFCLFIFHNHSICFCSLIRTCSAVHPRKTKKHFSLDNHSWLTQGRAVGLLHELTQEQKVNYVT